MCPLAYLEGKLVKQMMLGGVRASDVHNAPEIGHFYHQHHEGVNKTEGFLMLPGAEECTVAVNEENGQSEKDQRNEMGKGPIPKVARFSVAKKAVAEEVTPNLI